MSEGLPVTDDVSLESPEESTEDGHTRSPLGILALAALGIVYGDIGTSPLYALRECFFGPHGVPVTHENVLGILSLVFWSLVIVVMVKYHVYVLRADNRGEGGILALMALVRPVVRPGRSRMILVGLGLFGAALLYGDGIITPAISVLGALEGLEVATTSFTPYIVPLTVVVLVALFLIQRRGTRGIGSIFGPVMLIWFSTLAVMGVSSIVRNPAVLVAVNPIHALRFFERNGLSGYLVLGAVFLVATGGEALYADLGHFGEKPIQLDWFGLVFPALALNYFGQGALLLRNPAAAMNPFYHLAPAWARYPLVVLATAATVIASQAVISGVFSLTRQAVQLGYAPRVRIIHTSARDIGQIYVPIANWALMAATVGLVLAFRSSSALAAAYGIAVTTTMMVTTMLAFVVARRIWHWNFVVALVVTAMFLVVDTAFFGANFVKIAQGGWLPILIGIALFVLMSVWKEGQQMVAERTRIRQLPMEAVIGDIERRKIERVPGTAVFLTREADGVPIALLHNIKLNRVLHERNMLVSVTTEESPHRPDDARLDVENLGAGFYRIVLRYGFMESPDVPEDLTRLADRGIAFDPQAAIYILNSQTLVAGSNKGPWRLFSALFSFMSRNALRAHSFFNLPPNRVAELGMIIEV